MTLLQVFALSAQVVFSFAVLGVAVAVANLSDRVQHLERRLAALEQWR